MADPITSPPEPDAPHPAASPSRSRPVLPARDSFLAERRENYLLDRPPLPSRPNENPVKSAAPPPNPFVAIEEAHKAVVQAHQDLVSFAERLVGGLPAWGVPDKTGGPPQASGLFAITTTAADEMAQRAAHMRAIVERLEAYLA